MELPAMKYPIGIQNYEKMRNDGYVYVDKTAFIYRLVNTGSYYFLSRPRRFGKSLLISTMDAYFSGKKELFVGTEIAKYEKDWVKRPVLHLDLNTEKYVDETSLDRILDINLSKWEDLYGSYEKETSFSLRFAGVIERACKKTGHRVAILVDEYDKPLLQTIGNEKLQDDFRATLKAFYSVLKTQDGYIKFGFLTGVTKFGKVSVFSDLNNLSDISMDEEYQSICGMTEDELHENFDNSVALLAEKNGMNKDVCYAKLKDQYDGYHFRQNGVGIYNPFSLLNTLKAKEFKDYWFETGTPSFLVYLMQKTNYNLNRLQDQEVSAKVLNSIDSTSRDPVPMIYQSGYLTIKGYDNEFGSYQLGFPNKEVENGFINYLLPLYTPVEESETEFFIKNFIKDVRKGDADSFIERLQAMFADTDYKIVGKMELYFQNAMYVVFKMMGFYIDVERTTNRGRIDVVLKTKNYIYVMELKLDGSADDALRQIEEKGYAEPFKKDGRRLFRIGIDFSSETRGIKDWKISI